MEYSVIIPAYNEALNIERAIRETAMIFNLYGKPYEIIIVDDYSDDKTKFIVQSLQGEFPVLRLVSHKENMGKGTAVKTGVFSAKGSKLLFMDCDLATHPREATAFIAELDNADIVIGSRRAEGAVIAVSQSWYRILYGRIINFFIRVFLGVPHLDTQCGFKMFHAPVARELFDEIGQMRWIFDVELLLRARAKDYKISELPITWTNGKVSRVKVKEVILDLMYLLTLKNLLKKQL